MLTIYWKFLKQNSICLRIRHTLLSISEIAFIANWYKVSTSKHVFCSAETSQLPLIQNYCIPAKELSNTFQFNAN